MSILLVIITVAIYQLSLKNLFELESLVSGMRSIAQVPSDGLYVPGGIETASDDTECGLWYLEILKINTSGKNGLKNMVGKFCPCCYTEWVYN